MKPENIRRALAPWLIFLCLILVTASALPFFGRWHWLADLFSHFVPHYLVAGSVLFPGLIWSRRYPWAATTFVIVSWNAWLLSPYLLPQRAAQFNDAASLELLQFNLSRGNPAPLATIGYILSLDQPPDVVVLFEIEPAFAADVRRLNQIYPTIAQMPRNDSFGMALLSRLPESQVEFRESGELKLPLLVLTGRIGDENIRIFAAHPPPPLGAELSQARNDQIEKLADEISAAGGGQIVVAGDLNTTIWSHAFTPLVEKARLRDAQRGRGYLPTWAPPPYARWIGVAIDHTLVSERVEVQQRHVGPWLASDHWPVHTRLKVR